MKLAELWATPLAPEVVPEVKPTRAGASRSMSSAMYGVAAVASSNVVHPVAAPRNTTRRSGRWPAAWQASATRATWSTPRNDSGTTTHRGRTAWTTWRSSCSR